MVTRGYRIIATGRLIVEGGVQPSFPETILIRGKMTNYCSMWSKEIVRRCARESGFTRLFFANRPVVSCMYTHACATYLRQAVTRTFSSAFILVPVAGGHARCSVHLIIGERSCYCKDTCDPLVWRCARSYTVVCVTCGVMRYTEAWPKQREREASVAECRTRSGGRVHARRKLITTKARSKARLKIPGSLSVPRRSPSLLWQRLICVMRHRVPALRGSLRVLSP